MMSHGFGENPREPNSWVTTQVSSGPSFQKRFGRVQDRFRLFDVQVLFDQKTSEKTGEKRRKPNVSDVPSQKKRLTCHVPPKKYIILVFHW